ncbi:hypothetical protein TVAG_447230 [Trichomonas vaginalis G3]|uniref:Uncharacterized protein n=1 Tax=Trichomonas vaginalis (strain ATCC PRA-98 / G3) TaxID=412133 RepID=A2DRZ5_TRIV3|nr:P-loop containing nucleoside triphosphate hydrolases family [Trichomonas vaginalis G3]EAY16765.1 hypothetical protein TVAG_447230 [Trichomonas vaginalis G3]KAI5490828.1 P-loop containing nucleoside triphosphate hydrolases family [Trichomonas vaginalis G3]|eukprot:XP_001328988.1 hypothetical protein [Trichomonas vaginalis G3]
MSEEHLEKELAETSKLLKEKAKHQEDGEANHANEPNHATSEQSRSIKAYLYGFLTLLVLIILLVIFYPRRPPRSPYLPVPYVWNKQYLKELKHFTKFTGHANVLIATGPPGIGKSSGLYRFAELTNKTLQTPLILDCEIISETASVKDIGAIFLDFLIKGFEDIDGRPINLTILANSIPELKTIKAPTHPDTANLNDKSLINIANYGASILSHIEQDPSSSIFNFMELVDRTTEVLGTFLFIIEPSKLMNLQNSKARKAADGLVYFINNFKQGNYRIPCVVTESNLLSKNSQQVYQDLTWFKVINVEEFDIQDGKTILVNQERVFPKKLYFNLYSKFGGYGQLFVTVHDLIREKVSNQETLKQISNYNSLNIAKTVHQGADGNKTLISDRYSFLKRLTTLKMVKITPANQHLVHHFLEHGVVKLTPKMNAVVPSNRLIKSIIRDAIKYAKK